MPPKKVVPYREGYKFETRFPKKRSVLLTPIHGAGPRCRVDYNPDDDGLWAMLQIMRVDDDQTEDYRCAMPHYYAIPLILMNKRIAYFEAQCAPDSTPFPAGDGTVGLKQRELKEYAYLWRVRCRFLQDVFDMNHERELDEAWRCDRIHGFVHRTYKRYGHDAYQRHAYWRDEIEAGRMPYTTPDIADMGTCRRCCRPSPPPPSIKCSGMRRADGFLQDWKAFLAEEMTASTRLNAFLWNRISQGYSRVVHDDPPFASWQAWSRGGPSRDQSASLYRTPPPSVPIPAPGRPSSSSSHVSDSAAAEQEEEEDDDEDGETAAAARAAARKKEKAAVIGCGSTTFDGDNNNRDCGGILAATFDGSQEWALKFPTSDLSRGAGQAAASTGGTGNPSHRMFFALDVPEGMAVKDVLWTMSRVEDVGNNHSKSKIAAYRF
jgi:hypothetical protein